MQQFLGGLDSKQKPGSLNIALIHTYFLEWDYQRTKQLIHGNVFFFSLSGFPAYMAGVILSRAGQARKVSQFSGTAISNSLSGYLWRCCLAFGPLATIAASAKDIS